MVEKEVKIKDETMETNYESEADSIEEEIKQIKIRVRPERAKIDTTLIEKGKAPLKKNGEPSMRGVKKEKEKEKIPTLGKITEALPPTIHSQILGVKINNGPEVKQPDNGISLEEVARRKQLLKDYLMGKI